MMNLGLFEDPYVDPQNALDVVDNPETQQLADEAHNKSIVLLRNDENLLPLKDAKLKGVKLYVEMFPGGTDGASTKGLIETIKSTILLLQLRIILKRLHMHMFMLNQFSQTGIIILESL